MGSRTFRINESSITITFGDLTTSSAEILVSSDDYMLTMGGGVSAAILRGGGEAIWIDARKHIPLEAGGVAITTAGELRAKYIAHAITIGRDHVNAGSGGSPSAASQAAVIRTATRSALEAMANLGCTSIAFPSIGTGVAGFSPEVAATQMAATIVEYLLATGSPLTVELWLMSRFGPTTEQDYFMYFEEFARAEFGLQDASEAPPEAGAHDFLEPTQGNPRELEIYELLKHLSARRAELETELVGALNSGGDLLSIQSELQQIKDLRQMFTAELTELGQPSSVVPGTIFVSSTRKDLERHRQAVREVIDEAGLTYVGMEDFEAEGTAPADMICRRVRESDHYLGILGRRYGHVDPVTQLSMTELEYREALASRKQIYLFVMDDDACVTWSNVEQDPDKFKRLLAFRERVMKRHVCVPFRDEDDLAQKVAKTLAKS